MLYFSCFPPQERRLPASWLAFSQRPFAIWYASQRLATTRCGRRSSGRRAPAACRVLHHPLPDPTYLTGAA